jgi:hypothetical protein
MSTLAPETTSMQGSTYYTLEEPEVREFKAVSSGDQILLKAGSVWRGETLDIATSDQSGDPIVIGS